MEHDPPRPGAHRPIGLGLVGVAKEHVLEVLGDEDPLHLNVGITDQPLDQRPVPRDVKGGGAV